jgi:hypothetical protein
MSKNKQTNTAAKPAPTEVDDSTLQSEHAALSEDVILFAVKKLRAAGIACPFPEYDLGVGRTHRCDSGREAQLAMVTVQQSRNRDLGRVSTIIGNRFLVQSSDVHVASLLHGVAALAGMIAKSREVVRTHTRKNKVFSEALTILGLESDASQDFKGTKGGVCEFQISADTRHDMQSIVAAMDSLDVNGGQDAGEKAAKKPSFTLSASFRTQEEVEAVLAMLGVESKSKASPLLASLLIELAGAGVSVPDLSVAV